MVVGKRGTRNRDQGAVVKSRIVLTAVFEPVENGWTQARIEELPAVITAGPTIEEARALLLDALHEYLLSLGEQSDARMTRQPARREPLLVSLGA